MVTFELKEAPMGKSRGQVVEYVRIRYGTSEVHREATDKDRKQYASAYLAFKNPPPVVEAKTDEEIRAEDSTATYTEKERAMALEEKTPIDSPILRAALKPFRKKK